MRAVGECDLERDPIGGLVQHVGQSLLDQTEDGVGAVRLLQDLGALLADRQQAAVVEILEGRQGLWSARR